ncbi:MAG: DUF2264 domain-containing protein [Clostridiales bacterium]|nr:DUF2264 domain-containing protein [Clostridiales bacterium]
MKRYHYTVEDFSTKPAAQAALMRLLQPLKPFYSEGGARLELGVTSTHYENDSIEMESFARPLWGLIPFWRGGGREALPSSGTSGTSCLPVFEELYPRGMAAGADPANPEYWHTCRDFDQKFCEMAAISYGMLLAPEHLWDPLSEQAKANLTEWLWEINRHECCACNWQWFAIMTNVALKVRGRPYSQEKIDSGLAMLEDYYDEGGWYRDGNGGDKDYYNPFVMVSYGLLYAMFMEDEEPERCRAFRERARMFARDYVYWFADDGASIAYGRSMTYRFAQVAFFSVALLAGEEVLPLPVMKGIIARHLTWWLNQPLYDNAGVLTIGYAYPNLQMSESYNAPGSPYWALKAFAFLALPDEHPFWSVEAAPMPPLERQHYLAHAGMFLQRGKDNVVALVPGRLQADGHSHTVEKYSKFAYSSRFGFSISRTPVTLGEMAPDSMLCFQVGGYFYVKDLAEPGYHIGDDGLDFRWSPLEGIRVRTRLVPNEGGHLRIHTVESDYDCTACDCGFALSTDDRIAFSRRAEGPTAEVVSQSDRCAVTSLAGDGRGEVLIPDPNTNLIATKTSIPMAVYAIHKGTQTIQTQVDYL